jgi:hypothetical protein
MGDERIRTGIRRKNTGDINQTGEVRGGNKDDKN